MSKILITGAGGFLGRNLVCHLRQMQEHNVYEATRSTTREELHSYVREADVIFHLAGENRPRNAADYWVGNADYTSQICNVLRDVRTSPHLLYASSIQVERDNPYGQSKRAAEDALVKLSRETDCRVSIFRLPNIFGKWARPNYNSVVATFCHNLARGLPITVHDPNTKLALTYVDDVVADLVAAATSEAFSGHRFCSVSHIQDIGLGDLAGRLRDFSENRRTLKMPRLSEEFDRKLYATFLANLPVNNLGYSLDQKVDQRGVLAEFIKSNDAGQIFVSRTKPGVTRGHHYHHTKAEKFLVLEGEAAIRLRNMANDESVEYVVRGIDLKVIDIPPGFTHSIENVGDSEMIVLFWASEIFDSANPDTIYSQVTLERDCTNESSDRRRHAA